MRAGRFLERQWKGYGVAHQSRINLVLHVVGVPLFMLATILGVYAVVRLSQSALGAAVVCFVISLILQGRGHKLEAVQPEPFKGGFDFIFRIFSEQWITFPRFVLTGGWVANFSKAGRS
jgi:uncharacterized membrane protein YGL010W